MPKLSLSAKASDTVSRQIDSELELFSRSNAKGTYTIEYLYNNWYQALPYGFKHVNRKGKVLFMFLPISPSNMTITTHYATTVIPTLYGTVEEHSEQRYFDIVIDGTTGMSPRYPFLMEGDDPGGPDSSPDDMLVRQDNFRRDSFMIKRNLAGLAGGFFQRTLGTLQNAADKAADLARSVGISGNMFGFGTDKPQTGVLPEASGYTAFHNLYRFFLHYKKDTSGELSNRQRRNGHPLQFLNYKDNNQYDVSIQRFTLKRNVDNPLLYNYQIILRAYNLQTIFGDPTREVNGNELEARLETLGITAEEGAESSSIFSKMKNISGKGKSILGAGKGLGRSFGR